MDWLTLWFTLQVGMINTNMEIIGNDIPIPKWQTPEYSIETTIEMRARIFEHIELMNSIRSWQKPATETPFFNPFRIDYQIAAALVWGPVKIGISHECDHSVDGRGTWGTVFEKSETEAFIRIETKCNFE